MNKAETAAPKFDPAKNGRMRIVEVDAYAELGYLTLEVFLVNY
jgi:hypothetical protein